GEFVAKWGSEGSGDGQFTTPTGIAADCSGNVYVADKDASRVQWFDSSGTFLGRWGANGGDGTGGSGDGEFANAFGIAADCSGNVYVVDGGNDRIQKFTSAGAYVAQWGGPGSGDGEFDGPWGVSADCAGNVYVADTGN